MVAQHARELAERSKGATPQVGEILSAIEQASQAAVLVTDEGTTGVEEDAQASVQTAAAAQQQTAGMKQIGQAMGSIQQATSQALASTRQAERAAQDRHALAQSLQRTVETYRLRRKPFQIRTRVASAGPVRRGIFAAMRERNRKVSALGAGRPNPQARGGAIEVY